MTLIATLPDSEFDAAIAAMLHEDLPPVDRRAGCTWDYSDPANRHYRCGQRVIGTVTPGWRWTVDIPTQPQVKGSTRTDIEAAQEVERLAAIHGYTRRKL
jgi:hypothetical protein